MNRIVDRRTFLKAGVLLGGTAALAGMAGCASQERASSASSVAASSDGSIAESAAVSAQDAGSSAVPAHAGAESIAVVYFSCTGNTQAVADEIAQAVQVAPQEIVPAQPYAPDDLDYNADCRANAEQNEGTARPALGNPVPDVSGADVIYLGYPIWWGKAPRIILTFLEQANTSGKTIIPFCTSGGSGIEGSLPEIEAAAPNAVVEDARRFSQGASQADVDAWVADAA